MDFDKLTDDELVEVARTGSLSERSIALSHLSMRKHERHEREICECGHSRSSHANDCAGCHACRSCLSFVEAA